MQNYDLQTSMRLLEWNSTFLIQAVFVFDTV